MANEQLIKYREEQLNRKSKSFCGAKWGNSTLWLNTGETSSCHLPPVHKIDIEAIKKEPSKLHNTDHKINMRKAMLKGGRPKECEYCWKIEDMGDEYISDRVFKSLQFSNEELEKWFNNKADTLIVPPTLEIMFDRPCNFACAYCNANFSTSWANDIKKYGFYDLQTDGGGAYKHDGSPNNAWEHKENPFIEAFWKWWPELSKELRILRVTGGEPLLSKEVQKLINKCIKEQPEFELSINSNLGASDNIIEKFIKDINQIKKVTIFTSMESTGKQAEYIRYGLDYEKWNKNVFKILNETKIRRLTVMLTINALCIFSLKDFLNKMLEYKSKFGEHRVGLSVNFLRFPAFMSITILPDFLRNKVVKELEKWFNEAKKTNLLSTTENSDIERLIQYLKVVKTAHSYDKDLELNRRDFKKFFIQYDERRNINIFDIFPKDFLEWFEQIKYKD